MFLFLSGVQVVHLAHAYMQSRKRTALDRTHDALRDMGISVFWGMATSFIASLVLSICQLQVSYI